MDVISLTPSGVLPSGCTSDPCLTDPEPRPWVSRELVPGRSRGEAGRCPECADERMWWTPSSPLPIVTRRRQFLSLLRHEHQACQLPGRSHGTRPPDPHCCEPGPPALRSAGGPEVSCGQRPVSQAGQGGAVLGRSPPPGGWNPFSRPLPLGSHRHQRVPGQQRRLRPLLPQHRGQLRVQLPEGLQAADRRADVPG